MAEARSLVAYSSAVQGWPMSILRAVDRHWGGDGDERRPHHRARACRADNL